MPPLSMGPRGAWSGGGSAPLNYSGGSPGAYGAPPGSNGPPGPSTPIMPSPQDSSNSGKCWPFHRCWARCGVAETTELCGVYCFCLLGYPVVSCSKKIRENKSNESYYKIRDFGFSWVDLVWRNCQWINNGGGGSE